MRFSVWSDGSAPVYLNPTFDEIVELAKTGVDTLRICEEPDRLAVASGFGNTHESVTKIARQYWGNRFFGHTHILYKKMGTWFWNIDCQYEHGIRLERGCMVVEPITAQFVKDFVSVVDQL